WFSVGLRSAATTESEETNSSTESASFQRAHERSASARRAEGKAKSAEQTHLCLARFSRARAVWCLCGVYAQALPCNASVVKERLRFGSPGQSIPAPFRARNRIRHGVGWRSPEAAAGSPSTTGADNGRWD